ncbi:MAG: hypothetical protein JWP44_326 [Mucilaginibacter sp.]|nr:hypothetical protein [Mucilaginibacter sp.]
MEERKTAAIVLGIIGLIVVFFTVILPEIRLRSTQTISFRNCTVHFKYWDKGLVSDIYRVSQDKLALCLCKGYQQKPDTALGNRIIQIYRQYGSDNDSTKLYNNVDSIIKHKSEVLDTLITLD